MVRIRSRGQRIGTTDRPMTIRSALLAIAIAIALVPTLAPAPEARAAPSATASVRVEHHVAGAEKFRVAFVMPGQPASPLPLIVVQHGSSPTESLGTCPLFGSKQDCVRTDIFSTELVRQAVAAGFAAAVIDAFSELGVSNQDKTRFPNATRYAVSLVNALRADTRFDVTRIYYTGFSYGGASVLGAISLPAAPFRAIAPVEAGCQIQPAGRRLRYPVLFVLGDRSHYPPQPCLHLTKALQGAGTDAQAVVLEGADHNFGVGPVRSGPSRTLNGCTDNPVIVDGTGWRHLNGQRTDREEAMRTCTTFIGYGSQDATLLPTAVEHVVAFFKRHSRER